MADQSTSNGTSNVSLSLGVKTDPIEHRYSLDWLCELLAREGIDRIQLGSFFELYHLPDESIHAMRQAAERHGVGIDSVFTAHRELGGFFINDQGYERAARRCFERFIEVAGLVGARSVGSNPGAVLRDQMADKARGIDCYIKHMKELMHFAHEQGVSWLTIEPMSCLAEPPTLPEEIQRMGSELSDYHRAHPDSTANVGFCFDIAHGYINAEGQTQHDHYALLDAVAPWLYEVHLKNTDAWYDDTFGFGPTEREEGIIDVPQMRRAIEGYAAQLPVQAMTGYLEIGGPKLGRDYTDDRLADELTQSLRYLRSAWLGEPAADPTAASDTPAAKNVQASARDSAERDIRVAPSMMCVDPLNFDRELRRVEALGVDALHMDVMDGHFVPNMPLGLDLVTALSRRTDYPLDVHLMVSDSDFFIDLLRPAEPDAISVHVESTQHLDRTLTHAREVANRVGVALNPATPLDAIAYVLERLDYVLVMTVNPGFAGQKLTPASLRKIADCRALLDRCGYEAMPIQVDGNVSFANIPGMVAAGASSLVAGSSSIFHRDGSLEANLEKLHQCIRDGLNQRAAAGSADGRNDTGPTTSGSRSASIGSTR